MLRRLSRARSGSEAGADESGGDAGEPQWELPEDLQEYRGDPGDRKALLAFRQEQHAARQVHPRSTLLEPVKMIPKSAKIFHLYVWPC